MGKTITPKYAMTMECAGIHATDSCWRGRPTEKRLREHLEMYNKSLEPGGCNEHLTKAFGPRARALAGSIVHNDSTREVVCTVVL